MSCAPELFQEIENNFPVEGEASHNDATIFSFTEK